jgi:hypothetical protein
MSDKYRGFKAVPRMFDEDIKPLYPSRVDTRSSFCYLYYPYKETLVLQPGEEAEIKSGLKAYMLPNERLDILSSYGNILDWIDGSRIYSDKEIIVKVKNDKKEPIEIPYKNKYARVSFTNYLVLDFDFVITDQKRINHS